MLKESTKVGNTNGVRDSWKEAEAAINFWQALEYLAPQSPPSVKLEDSVWEFEHDATDRELPWKDPKKRTIAASPLIITNCYLTKEIEHNATIESL